MPRICTSNSDPLDFCKACLPDEEDAEKTYGLENFGPGPDGRGDCFAYEPFHPDYAECDYTCERCGDELTAKDN